MNNSTYDYCLIGGYSDVGRVRKANEDRGVWFDSPNGRIGVVCDGMGGHVGGQIASQTAIEAIQEFLTNNLFDDPKEAICNSIIFANQAIITKAQIQPELNGMGSTCVMLLIRDGKVYYGHVGDSRIYIVSSRIIRQLTKDHSFVQILVDTGQITKDEAEKHPRKNEITNALGIPNMQPPSVSNTPIEPEAGTCFILCSDGLTGMVDDKKIEKVVSNRLLTLNQRAKELIDLANEAGGVDNITVQLVEFALGASDIHTPVSKRSRSVLPYLTVIAVVLLCALGVYRLLKKSPEAPQTDKTPSHLVESIKPKEQQKITALDSIQYIKDGQTTKVATGIDKKYRIYKDSVSIENGADKFISIDYVTSDNEIAFKWANKQFDKDQVQIRIETDSVSFIVTYNIKRSELKPKKKNVPIASGTSRTQVAQPPTEPTIIPPTIPTKPSEKQTEENVESTKQNGSTDDKREPSDEKGKSSDGAK